MISIIISSVKKEFLNDVSKNIEETIGVPFEIISFDNSGGENGLCELYNKGARLAKFEYICYMHEDIEIKTELWGQRVLGIFRENQELGLLGIAGTSYKSLAPSGWYTVPTDMEVNHANIIQVFKYRSNHTEHFYSNPRNERLTSVACVDGVWFCTKRAYALQFPFDEILLKGFHCYDLDFSFSIGQKYMVAVTYDIMIKHFSEGNYDQSWLVETLKLHKKWEQHLPINVAGLSRKQKKIIEKAAYYHTIDNMRAYKFGTKVKLAMFNLTKLITQVGLRSTLKLYFYTVFKA